MNSQPESMTLDPNSKSDMDAVKQELTAKDKDHKNSLRFDLMKVVFDEPLKDHQADAVIKLLSDVVEYNFDVTDVCVHVANLAILFGVKAQFKATCDMKKPKRTFAFIKAARILNDAIKKGEVIPWEMPAEYQDSHKNEMEEDNHEEKDTQPEV